MTPDSETLQEVEPRAVSRRKGRVALWRSVLLLVLPFTIVYVTFLIYPTIRVVMLSFTNADIAGQGSYVGLKNYSNLFRDPLFWASLWHTIYVPDGVSRQARPLSCLPGGVHDTRGN